MPRAGLEPARTYKVHMALNHARLPIPPPRQRGTSYLTVQSLSTGTQCDSALEQGLTSTYDLSSLWDRSMMDGMLYNWGLSARR